MQPRHPVGASGSLFRHMSCPRCDTPLAVVGETTPRSQEQYTLAITSYARTLSERLQVFQPGATIPAYLVLRAQQRGSIVEILLVWPEYHAARLRAEDFARVRPALQALHRCIPLVRLY